MSKIPPGTKFEIINLNRRYTRAEMERLSQPKFPGDDGIKFIAVQRIEEAEACYIIDPSNFGAPSDFLKYGRYGRYGRAEKERG